MRDYEIIFVLTPTLGDDGIGPVIDEFRKVLTDGGLTPTEDNTWGRRRLAYLVDDHKEGYYHQFDVQAEDSVVIDELDRRFRLSENVLRFLTVRTDEETKRQKKTDRRQAARKKPEPEAPADAPAEAPAPAQDTAASAEPSA